MAWAAAHDPRRSYQWSEDRLAERQSTHALPKLSQSNAHLRRSQPSTPPLAAHATMRKCHDWTAIQRYHDEGHDQKDCRKAFGVAYGAWMMAIRRGKLRVRPMTSAHGPRYDWRLVRAYYDQGHSLYQCMSAFGFCLASWHKAVRRGDIAVRPLGRPLVEILRTGKSRANIKRRLLRVGLLQKRCQDCNISEWMGEPLSIQIDHVNGDRTDHRLENLRMLCPNCHSQTATYGRRNGKRAELQEPPGPL